jgi:heme/copper-type cytochrome/quinol oxidase subunit 4
MYTIVWIFIAVIVAVAIYWIMDWKKQHPDGE